ncbi:MAG: DUF2764 family protein [Bacteroidales bacterium]|nr:DUF2764 family protein [Bacteroidales bacterium]
MMFPRYYHYIVAGLPDMILDQKKLSFSTAEFRNELKEHLHPDDYDLVCLLFLPADNSNLLNLLRKKKEPFLETGNYSMKMLEAEINEPSDLPAYMQQFIHAYKFESPVFHGYTWDDQLAWLYYDHMLQTDNRFLKEWFTFDLHVKNVRSALNARRYKLSTVAAYIGNNAINDALKSSTLTDFGLSNEFPFVNELTTIDEDGNPMEKELAVDMLRWKQLDELNTFHYFTIEVLLSFVIRLIMAERWIQLQPEAGRKMFREITENLKKSYVFPKEFNI